MVANVSIKKIAGSKSGARLLSVRIYGEYVGYAIEKSNGLIKFTETARVAYHTSTHSDRYDLVSYVEDNY